MRSDILYPRGFAFSENKIEKLPESYSQISIIDKYYYAYDKKMTVNLLTDEDKFLIIHGEYVHVGEDFNFTSKGLKQYLFKNYFENYSLFLETLDFLAGRYVIIVGDG